MIVRFRFKVRRLQLRSLKSSRYSNTESQLNLRCPEKSFKRSFILKSSLWCKMRLKQGDLQLWIQLLLKIHHRLRHCPNRISTLKWGTLLRRETLQETSMTPLSEYYLCLWLSRGQFKDENQRCRIITSKNLAILPSTIKRETNLLLCKVFPNKLLNLYLLNGGGLSKAGCDLKLYTIQISSTQTRITPDKTMVTQWWPVVRMTRETDICLCLTVNNQTQNWKTNK